MVSVKAPDAATEVSREELVKRLKEFLVKTGRFETLKVFLSELNSKRDASNSTAHILCKDAMLKVHQ